MIHVRSSIWWCFIQQAVASRAVMLLAVLLAGWPVLRWYAARLGDGSDEPLGLAALGAALWFAPRAGWLAPAALRRRVLVCCLLAGYLLGFPFTPPLLRATIWISAVAACASPARGALAWWTLLSLSLPWVATLQFYLGYPLRCVTTQAAALLLRMGGLRVTAEGTVLAWAGERVLIDLPCSGIQMGWTMLALSAAMALLHGLGTGPTLAFFRRAGALVLVANCLRAVVLFCLELRLWPWLPGSFSHEAVGLVAFALAAAAAFALRPTGAAPAPVSP